MRLALLIPHIFMQAEILPEVIFSPGELLLHLALALQARGHEVTIFSPGKLDLPAGVKNQTADLSLFEKELALRGDSYLDLLKKHPLTFITLARQVQTELIAKAYRLANEGQFDLVHVWCNEEELALVMADFCQKPVVFTHHEPFNFLSKYQSIFPKYAHLNWISLSLAQQAGYQQLLASAVSTNSGAIELKNSCQGQKTFGRNKVANQSFPTKVNFIANVYHGLPKNYYNFDRQADDADLAVNFQADSNRRAQTTASLDNLPSTKQDYFLYMGRIIQPKGVHLAIKACQLAGVKLKIVGKHYAGFAKDKYWTEQIAPQIDGKQIEYLGFISGQPAKQQLLSSAKALLMPSIWQEPFGLVMVEALACGTPVIGVNRGAIPELIEDGKTGWLVDGIDEAMLIKKLAQAIKKIDQINRLTCRHSFEKQFTINQMADGYEKVYKSLANLA